MAKNQVSEWDATPSGNTDVGGIGIQGSNLVSNFDGAVQTIMAQIKTFSLTLGYLAGSNIWSGANTFNGISTFAGSTLLQGSVGVSGLSTFQNTVVVQGAPAAPNQSSPSVAFYGKDGNQKGYQYYDGPANSYNIVCAVGALYLKANSGIATVEGSAGVNLVTAGSARVVKVNGTTGSLSVGADAYDGSVATVTGVNISGYNSSNPGAISATTANLSTLFLNRQSSDGTIISFFRAASFVGSVSVNGSGTSFNTSSDETLKDFIGVYDPDKAIDIIRRDPVRDFRWKETGAYAVGWGAQTSYAVSKDLATPGHGEPGDDDYQTWGIDQAKRVPYLWAALTKALDVIDDLTERVAALEAR